MSLFGHKELASYLLHKNVDKRCDSYELQGTIWDHKEVDLVFNKRLINLNNLPSHLGIKTNRAHTGAFIRACHGTQQNAAKSLDLLRQIIQNSINVEIEKIISKYVNLYFLPAKRNISTNNEGYEVSKEHLQNVCCQILEEAKKMYTMDFQTKPDDESENVVPKRRKRTFSSGSDSKLPFLSKKIKHGSFLNKIVSGRSTPNKGKFVEPVRKEGPRWDSKRMTEETLFIMGSKANKALGLGATRGRLYIKHPDIFKYAGDQDDKQWLYEKMHMPATGGRTYLLLVEDILHLTQTEEYRNSPGLMVDEIVGFTVPLWMLKKMKEQMDAQRTDKHLRKESHGTIELLSHEVTDIRMKHGTDSEHSSELPYMEDANGYDDIDNDDPRDRDYTCIGN